MNPFRLTSRRLTRRQLLKRGAIASVCVPFLGSSSILVGEQAHKPSPKPTVPGTPQTSPFYQVDEALLEQIENANFLYFWEQADPETGLVRDRCNAINPDKSDLASIASTGFGLTAL